MNIQLIDCMGSDLTVVNAARVSLHKESKLNDDGSLKEEDIKLIKYLAKHGHWTPFSQPQLQFRIKMPIFVARQYYKHQIGFTRNEVSRRYVKEKPDYFIPDYFRRSSESIKQGSIDEKNEFSDYWKNVLQNEFAHLIVLYENMIYDGIPAEQARLILPQSIYTEFIETASLYAYTRMYNLRSKPDAQKEIREYANEIGQIISEKFPVSWNALCPTN